VTERPHNEERTSRQTQRSIDYDYRANRHSLSSSRKALRFIFGSRVPSSVLDVGCGLGNWLKASRELGVEDVFGVDGVEVAESALMIPIERFRRVDLALPWTLNRKFDVAFCLEVAEHLDEASSVPLVDSLAQHADYVVFSAACPGQPGQHHVNCQWPSYWQALFNARGFVCSDAVRWALWNDSEIDVWYRQNMFTATRNALEAGKEARLHGVVHPDFLDVFASTSVSRNMADAEQGALPFAWYVTSLLTAFQSKLKHRLTRSGA
jgi:SAM-dependent methyltransferase